MTKTQISFAAIFILLIVLISCSKSDTNTPVVVDPYTAIKAAFGANIDPANLANYANQPKPTYLNPAKDNTGSNVITNAKATLGRVLFYDKNLSIDNSISCGSCHKQEFAFSDTAVTSKGVAFGLTARHSMRLINSRFAGETKFFWDERAATLEAQTTMPIQDHAEMGFSGQSGRPALNNLLVKLQALNYYNELFKFVYGDVTVTEARMQECLAQFLRSIQSFDSKYDAGRAQVNNDNQNFPNFTTNENDGKNLFLTAPVFNAQGTRISGGLGCNGCHNAPEFDIDPNTRNNGIIGVINSTATDLTVTRAPSLRDLLNTSGVQNGPMMHTGALLSIQAVVGHYNIIPTTGNTNLDARLRPNGVGQKLVLTTQETINVTQFLKTLSGTNVYTDRKWGNPFN
jgi:cytochrome c peroxidase